MGCWHASFDRRNAVGLPLHIFRYTQEKAVKIRLPLLTLLNKKAGETAITTAATPNQITQQNSMQKGEEP
jgi:hypothetical protein